MRNKTKNWAKNPTKRQALIVFIIWLIALFCVIINTTRFFSINPFIRANTFLLIATLVASMALLGVCRNYIRNKSYGGDFKPHEKKN